MTIKDLIDIIIPSENYESRNGFSNKNIIDGLSENEKILVEDILLLKLLEHSKSRNPDALIIETLTYMKSVKVIPILYKSLESITDKMYKIIIASSLYQLNGDEHLFTLVVTTLQEIRDPNLLIFALFYLLPFKIQKSKSILEGYLNHKDFLVRDNAKRYINMLEANR